MKFNEIKSLALERLLSHLFIQSRLLRNTLRKYLQRQFE